MAILPHDSEQIPNFHPECQKLSFPQVPAEKARIKRKYVKKGLGKRNHTETDETAPCTPPGFTKNKISAKKLLNLDILKTQIDPKTPDFHENLKYECPIEGCSQRFEKFQQLGGHKSKAHPKQSPTYTQKLITRERRT